MYITHITIKNFRNIQYASILPAQVNILSGDNGSGKSSLLYALMYGLTDRLPEKLSNYIRWGADSFYIELHFILYNKNYVLKIEHDGNKTKKELVCNTSQSIYYNSDATKYLQSLINTNVIYYSLFSEQGKTSQILFDTPANRLKKLKEILQIDNIEQLQDIIKTQLQEYKNHAVQYETELKLLQSKKYILKDIPDLSQYKDIEEEYNLLKEKKEYYDIQIKKYNEYCIQLKEYENFIVTYNRIKSQINEIEKKLQHYTSIEDIQKKIKEYKSKLQQLHQLYQNITISHTLIQTHEATLEKKKKELSSLIIRRLQSCSYTEEYKQSVHNQLVHVQYALQDIDTKIQLIQQGKCPTCQRPFDNVNMQDYVTQKENLQHTYTSLQETYTTVVQAITQYEKDKKEYDAVLQRRKDLENEIAELQTIITNEKEKYKEYIIQDITQQIKEYENLIAENESYITDYTTLYTQYTTLQKELQSITVIEKPIEVMQPEFFDEKYFTQIQNKVLQYEKEKAVYDAVKEYNSTIQKEKENDIKRKEELQMLYADVTQKTEQLKQGQDILLKVFPSYLIDKGAEFLKDIMNNFFMTTYGKYEITFSQDKNSIDFFYGTNNIYVPCALASGYEKSCLAIALRVALASLIPQCQILVLDEIDSDASGENSIKLYQSLLEYLLHYQFFIVTHIDETKEFLLQNFNSNFYIVQNGKVLLQ